MKKMYFGILISAALLLGVQFSNISVGQNSSPQSIASNIFNNKILEVPQTVKNFLILIPNEAHESPLLPKDQRLLNQPYVPQNIVVYPDTKIIWFAGDVGHTRKVTVSDENSKKIFDAVLKFNSASKPLSLNHTGKFTYFESEVNKEDPKFVMNGSITMTGREDTPNVNINKNESKSNFDTMSIIMVPTKDIEKHTKTLTENNVYLLDRYSFKDLRETGSGGTNQTLLVLGGGKSTDMLISVLKKITSSLPYS